MPLYESDLPSLPSCECPLLSLLHSHTNRRLPAMQKLPLPTSELSTHCQVTLHLGCGSHLALPSSVPAFQPPGAVFILLGSGIFPPGRHPSCPALALTPRVRLPSSGSTLVTFLGFWLHTPGHSLHGGPLHSAHVPALCASKTWAPGPSWAAVLLWCPPPWHPTAGARLAHPVLGLGFPGDVLAGLQHFMPIHVGSLTLLRLWHHGAGCLSIEMPSSTHFGTSHRATCSVDALPHPAWVPAPRDWLILLLGFLSSCPR